MTLSILRKCANLEETKAFYAEILEFDVSESAEETCTAQKAGGTLVFTAGELWDGPPHLCEAHPIHRFVTDKDNTMDADLDRMTREELVAEVQKLRQGIREHRDGSRHELCWHHPGLWGLLPEKTDPLPVVPEWPQFMQGCVRYRQSLDEQAPDAPRTREPYPK